VNSNSSGTLALALCFRLDGCGHGLVDRLVGKPGQLDHAPEKL
jgi:hypothetical protein